MKEIDMVIGRSMPYKTENTYLIDIVKGAFPKVVEHHINEWRCGKCFMDRTNRPDEWIEGEL